MPISITRARSFADEIFSLLHFPTFSIIILAYSSRVSCFILQDFRSATTGVAAKTMRNELNNMVNGVSDPSAKKVRLSHLGYPTPAKLSKRNCIEG
jgi:ribosomal protein L6P/L9E